MGEPSAEFDAARGALDRLLERRGLQTLELPYLEPKDGPGRAFLSELFKQIRAALRDYLPDFNLPPDGSFDWIIKSVLVAVLAALVVTALVWALKLYRKNQGASSALPTTLPATGTQLPRDGGKDLEAALARGDFGAALRFRWRLFLAQTAQAKDCTPLEYRSDERGASWAAELCAFMFDPTRAPARKEFDAYDRLLRQEEGRWMKAQLVGGVTP